MLGRGFEKAPDVAAARKMLAHGAQHDDADARVGVERLEHRAQLLALGIEMTLSGGRSRMMSARSRVGDRSRRGSRRGLSSAAAMAEASLRYAAVPCECLRSPADIRRRPASGARSCRPAISGSRRRTHNRAAACSRRGSSAAPGIERRRSTGARRLTKAVTTLAPAFVRQAGDGDLGDGRMQRQARSRYRPARSSRRR